MKKIVDYFLSCLYLPYFGLMLLIFHPVQMLCLSLGGRKAHQKSVQALNGFLLHGLWILGTRFRCTFQTPLPTDRPIVFVANHQSMFDIVGLIWFLRKYNPLFVSKIELSKGIPSISYNLRHSGAALINRKDGKQAIGEILKLSRLIEETKFSGVIFPEGTRSRTGALKEFATGGIKALLAKAPSAIVVPVAIQNTGKLNPQSIFPLRSFTSLTWTVLPPLDITGKNAEEITEMTRQAIQNYL
ncbi:MAG: 1-acyl-sn-glycerol-3-phosphate acyltransferase [Spirosomaceae bacterium]|jgi:1-acyl-sn-glycerol-3-phosphate acyltransferase|nr:1-acyl-sn-glycerol-3-phosphate acyltransferase [Spirosomataceae bacterium]